MNNAVLYVRLSREDENIFENGNKLNSKSIENQIALINNYAKLNNFNIVEKYIDDGFSGENVNRPALSKMLNDINKGVFNVVIIKDFSRLGRKMYFVANLVENIFPKNNIRLISIIDKFDSLNFNNEENVIFKYFVNEYYLKEFKRKCYIVRKLNYQTKHLNYYPKYGYNYDDNKVEIIDSYSANIVKTAFNLVGNLNYKVKEVVNYFNKNNVLTRSQYQTKVLNLKKLHNVPAKNWTSQMILSILTDVEYCGHSVNLVRSGVKNQIILKNTHNKIIDEDLFLKVQKKLNLTKKNKLNHIGEILIDKTTNKKLLYAKSNYNIKYDCYFLKISNKRKYSINAKALTKIIFLDLIESLKYKLKSKNLLYNKQKLLNKSEQLNKYNLSINNLIIKQKKNLEQYFSGNISKIEYLSKNTEISENIKYFQNKIESLNSINNTNKFKFDSKNFTYKEVVNIIRFSINKIRVSFNLENKIELSIYYKF